MEKVASLLQILGCNIWNASLQMFALAMFIISEQENYFVRLFRKD